MNNDTDDLEVPILYSAEDKPIQVYHHHGPWIVLTILLVVSIIFNIYLLSRNSRQQHDLDIYRQGKLLYLDRQGLYMEGLDGWAGWLFMPDYAHQPNWIEED